MSTEKEPFEIISARHYAATFSGSSGEFVMQDIMKACGFLQDGYDPDRPGFSEYMAGRRSVMLFILEKMQMNELHVLSMSKITSALNEAFKTSKEFDMVNGDNSPQSSDYEKATFRE